MQVRPKGTVCFNNAVMHPKDADGMANSVDPDQTSPLGTLCCGSALLAQIYLSKHLEFYGNIQT